MAHHLLLRYLYMVTSKINFGFKILFLWGILLSQAATGAGLTPKKKGLEKVFIQPQFWAKEFLGHLPDDLCKDEGYFLSCYSIDEKECRKTVEENLKASLNQSSIAEKQKRREKIEVLLEGPLIAQELADTMGKMMEASLEKKRVGGADCTVRGSFK